MFNVATGTTLTYSGAISGTGALTKTGAGTLTLGGSTGNTYAGVTTVTEGHVTLDKSSGVAIPGDLLFNGNTNSYMYWNASDQIGSSSVVTFNNPTGGSGRLFLYGHNQTLGGIVCAEQSGLHPNVDSQAGVSTDAVLTIDNDVNYEFQGYMRDKSSTSTSTGRLAIVKEGAARQTLTGNRIQYTGGTTINEGRLSFKDTTDATF